MFVMKCPECDAELKAKARPPEGKKIRCKECQTAFVPKVKEVQEKAAAPVKPVAAEKPAEPAAKPVDDDENDINPYGLVTEEDTEEQKAAKAKVRFDGVDDKKKRSARGPAMSLLVMPANLLVASGGLTFVIGLGTIIYGLWPLIFTDVSPSDDDYSEQLPWVLFGIIIAIWAALVLLGASRMQNLESYTWAMTGAIMGIPLALTGIFALITLRNPKVLAGFMEVEGAMDNEEEEEKDDDEDEDDEDDEDD
ncbi:zinc ribbon domain-containing protein [Limnoglobus roseus]|uniref:Uncharacterized protein n=1 Tax=Limnoglobus roseus TaxID=2598579 RepID=A0A5C1AEQ2_9BACT|nr:hypothetical protein [Limnoglobus roseus]QEL17240.1 hypothetical protein PX52LOC_04223 [Limnoglobus roseus]